MLLTFTNGDDVVSNDMQYSKYRSGTLVNGIERTAHRALLYSTGLDEADIGKPLIAVVNSFTEMVPGHIHLREIADYVKQGICEAGGIPREFNTIALCDGICQGHKGMSYPLPSREIIADSIEMMVEGHQLDAMVMLPGCDKIVPGMIMAAARLNIPAIVLPAGPMLEGKYKDIDVITLTDMRELAGRTQVGRLTVEELLALTEEYSVKLAAIISYDERIAELTVLCDTLYNKVKKQAAVLTKARTKVAGEVEKQIVARLVPLGMPNVRFQVEMGTRKEPGIHGEDTVNFLFSANKNGALQSISSVASGGEIARVMLSVKAMIAGAVKLPTIIFDEIDTGVSGEIADRMADIMQEMGEQDRQVISITHLPQIAARGCAHYKVYKQDNETETNSHIRRLADEERVEEIAHMLSGATLTEAALNNAKALLGVRK